MHVHAAVVDSETGEKHGSFNPVSTSVTLMPGVYDLRFAKSEWRFVKVDGGKTVTLRPAAVILAPELKWKAARITTQDGTEVFRFDAVTSRAALPPGDYIVEVDGNKNSVPRHRGRSARGEAAVEGWQYDTSHSFSDRTNAMRTGPGDGCRARRFGRRSRYWRREFVCSDRSRVRANPGNRGAADIRPVYRG